MFLPALFALAILCPAEGAETPSGSQLVATLELLPVGESNTTNIWVKPHPSATIDLEALRRECTTTGACEVGSIKSGERYHYFFARSTNSPSSSRHAAFISLLAFDASAGSTAEIWAVEFRPENAVSGTVQLHSTPYGEMLEVPVDWKGTAHFVTRLVFLWVDDRWLEIDAESWQTQLELPPCYSVFKGIDLDFASFSATTSVWIAGDGNCCPTGGTLTLQLELIDRAICVKTAHHDPPDFTHGKPGSVDEIWRIPYLHDCLAPKVQRQDTGK